MRVVLAGCNVEAAILEGARNEFHEAVTPEVISAAYARISRDPRGIAALRNEARGAVDKARRSNERIVFGFGHRSVAEHAVLNLDVAGISRLAVEEIEHFRLASYTEKSQRYIRLGKDIVVPPEIKGGRHEREFRSLMDHLHGAYKVAFQRIAAAGEELGAAKEDARYLMPLATSTQLGMTVNARELEYMIGRLAGHPLGELRVFSKKAFTVARSSIPSLVRYPEPSWHCLDIPTAKGEICLALPPRGSARHTGSARVRLIEVTPEADEQLAAVILFSSCRVPMPEAKAFVKRLGTKKREAIIAKTMRRLGPYDSVWREFENIHFLFELVVSASCYAQLKRHRIATLIPQPYDLSLGISMPATFERASAAAMLRDEAAHVERFYRSHVKELGAAAEYALLNAHRRRVLFGLNLRELYHFSRLRSDPSAQWEIRDISDAMRRLAEKEVPAGGRLLGGKERLEEKKGGIDPHK
jgi:flavin-dependent thymidylate synthase